jgi:serine/threonine protein kinase
MDCEKMIGKTILHYRIVEKLGEGGMGVVYKAEDTKLDRLVALKFLPQSLAMSETDRLRFVQEAKAAAAINHPNVCVIYAIEEHDGRQFIVMEYVEGASLRKKVASNQLAVNSVIEYAIQIGEALQAAHEKGIVHPTAVSRRLRSGDHLLDFARRTRFFNSESP